MLQSWKWSTIVFVCQVLVADVMYRLAGDIFFATIAFVAVAVAVAVAAATPTATAAAVAAATFAAVAFAIAVAATAATAATATVATFAAAVVVLVAFVATIAVVTDIQENTSPKEPFWLLFVAIFPLGVGTVIGGLLYLWWRNRERARTHT